MDYQQEIEKIEPWRSILETPFGQRFFPSEHALAWFIRINVEGLTSEGVLLRIRNRMFVDREKFIDYALKKFVQDGREYRTDRAGLSDALA